MQRGCALPSRAVGGGHQMGLLVRPWFSAACGFAGLYVRLLLAPSA